MNDWVEILGQDTMTLQLRLKDMSMLDQTLFETLQFDESCVKGVLTDAKQGILTYQISHLVSLEDLFLQHSFEKEEGYVFLHMLIEQIIATCRSKPVLLDPQLMFVNEHADQIYFVIVPIRLQAWMAQTGRLKEWLSYVSTHFKTQSAFEILGFMVRFLQSDEFSLPNLAQGLDHLRNIYYPKKWSLFKRKKNTSFYIAEPLSPIFQKAFVSNELPTELPENQTLIIGSLHTLKAYFMYQDQRYDLMDCDMLLGRSMACDIRLEDPSVSLKHAKISFTQDKYYILDLKSANGTYLNGKKVQRRMRLKSNMQVQAGNAILKFYQE